MNHGELGNAVDLAAALKEAGFFVSQVCVSRECCFDFAAKKDSRLVLVKVYSDVNMFSVHKARELKVVAARVYAASLVASQHTHEHQLVDDTVYTRYAVRVVTPKTLHNVATQTALPLVYAGPGGYFVEIDGELVQKRRKELGLSVGRLAEQIGVSRQSLYGYEQGLAKASVASAYNLTKTLGVAVAKPIDVLQQTKQRRQCLVRKSEQALEERLMLRKVFRNFACCDVTPVLRAPFDFIVNLPDEKRIILGAVAAADERFLDERVAEILSICKVLGAYPILVVGKKKPSAKDIFCVCIDELSDGRLPKDLVANF